MGFLSRRVRSSFLEQGVTSYNSYTLHRCVTLPMRYQLFVAQLGSLFPSTIPWCGVQKMIQANQFPLRDLACLLGVHHAHILNYGNGLYEPLDARTIVGRWGFPPICCISSTNYQLICTLRVITATTCTSGYMREEEDTADFSVPFQISWSTRNIRRKNHWRYWLLSPR